MNFPGLLLGCLAVASRVGLGVMFARGGWRKARDLATAAAIVAGYGVVPAVLARPAALALTGGEFLVGALLLAGAMRPGAADRWVGAAATGLLAVFAGAMVVVLRRGRAVACGCGDGGMVSARHLAATVALLPAAALAGLPFAPAAGLRIEAAVAGFLLLGLGGAGRRLVAA